MSADLTDYATTTEKRYLDAIEKHGSKRAAARALGVADSSIRKALVSLERRAARLGKAPGHFTSGVAPGYLMGKVTVQRSAAGEVERTWERQSPDNAARAEMLQAFADALGEGVKGLAPLTKPPKHSDDDLLCVYPMGDPHFGMYAWWQEAGENFDLEIAENLTRGAVDRLVSSAPNAATAILLCLGDLIHADDQSNTSKSGHQLDVDGRWTKVVQVAARAMIHAAKRLLEKHAKVIIRFNRGNHDGNSSYAIAIMLDCYFHNEPRITVDLSPSSAWYYEFSTVLIGSTHGDTFKGPDMLPVMASDKSEAWGRTKHRHWYVGHVHHSDLKEYRGGTVEYFRTLAARDAWHAGQGYRAGRDMRLIVHHRQHGEIERHRCDVSMLK